MTLAQLHTHLEWQEVDFLHLSRDYEHCVYGKDGIELTIPKLDTGELEPEFVYMVCKYFEIPVPVGISVD